MALVLAIEPDLRQAAILKRIVRERVKADLVVVDSRDAALDAIARGVPDVVLLSALMSPRDEDELIQRLRSLEQGDHVQTHTIPQLSSSLEDRAPSKARGLLSAFRRKKEPEGPSTGCDPDLFADEIKTFIKYAAEKKEERRAVLESGRLSATAAARVAAPAVPEPQPEEAAESGSSWDDPFAWPSSSTANSQRPTPKDQRPITKEVAEPEPVVAAAPEPEPIVAAAPEPEPVPEPEPIAAAGPPDPWATDYRPAGVFATTNSQPPTSAADVEIAAVVEALVEHRPITVPTAEDQLPTPNDHLPTVEEVGAVAEIAEPEPEAAPEPEPVAAAPALPRSLGPLATWVRFDLTVAKAEPQTTNDELRDLMAQLSVPPHVAGVTYARGCRIRRVRVPGGREKRKTSVPGPVILSRRQLEREREANA